MEEAVCKVAVVNLQGKSKPIVCHRSDKCTPLIALTNVMYLRGPQVVADHVSRTVSLGYLTEQLEVWADKFCRSDYNKGLRIPKETLVSAVRSLRHHPPLDPLNTQCNKFKGSIVVLLFRLLGIKLLHGWVLDPTDNKLSLLQGLSYNNLVESSPLTKQTPSSAGGVSDVQEIVDEDNPAEVFMNASKLQLTTYGLHQLHEELKERDLAVLYANNEYNVLHKYNDDLFTLETSEDNVMQLPVAVWRKLTIEEEESFYVTGWFSPTKGQQKEKEKLAREWCMAKISAFVDKKSTKKEAKIKRNLTKEVEDKAIDSSSESVLPISVVGQAEESTKSDVAGVAHQMPSEEPSAPPAIAEKFLEFLTV